jgi:hypothetical protein
VYITGEKQEKEKEKENSDAEPMDTDGVNK